MKGRHAEGGKGSEVWKKKKKTFAIKPYVAGARVMTKNYNA